MTKQEQLQKIKEADQLYYDAGQPVLSDTEYDALRNDYIEKYGNEDLDYVPGDTVTSQKFRHPIEVTSLAKVDEDDIEKFDSELERLSPLVVEPKYDGLTIVAYPVERIHSYQFVTRGSGAEGDILPWFISQYMGIYPIMSNAPELYAIRGEAYMSQENFEKMNRILVARGEEPKKNPRNAAAGILNPAAKKRSEFMDYLTYVCYDVIGYDASESKKLRYIRSYTPFEETPIYRPTPEMSTGKIREAIICMHEDIRNGLFKVNQQTVPIDGMVIKSDEDGSLAKFGFTGHHPKNAVAIKASQRATFTTLRDVKWQVGKTGAITPVAIFDPIEILGSTVSQASLSNPDEIERLDLHIGDEVGVIKAREIIPKIVLNHGGGEESIDIPNECPACYHELKKDGPVLFCKNPQCAEKIAQQMAFIAKKNVLNIPGLSIETCRKLVEYRRKEAEHGYEVLPYDVFSFDADEIQKALGTNAKKNSEKLAQAISDCRNTKHSFRNWLPALLIDGVGHKVADILVEHFGSPLKFEKYLFDEGNVEKLANIPGIGPVTAKKLFDVDTSYNWEELRKYVQFDTAEQEKSSSGGKLSGKTFVLTGKMPKKRSEYEAMIKEAGGTVGSSVSKNTDYLVIADVNSTSTKAEKARKLGTKLISPDELERMAMTLK